MILALLTDTHTCPEKPHQQPEEGGGDQSGLSKAAKGASLALNGALLSADFKTQWHYFQYGACLCIYFLHFLFSLNAFFLPFTTFTALHSNEDIFPFLISLVLFSLFPMEAVKACANIWACLRTLMHACIRVCAGHQVLTSPPTTSLKDRKKCGEKSVWTQSINIQRWRSDPLVLPLSSIHVFSLSETSCRLKTHHSLWNWQHAWQWPHLCLYICRPSVSPVFCFVFFFVFYWEKKSSSSRGECLLSLSNTHTQKMR